MGSIQRKKTVELKLITSELLYRLNNLESRISSFAKKFNLGCLRAPLGRKYGEKPPPIHKLLCLNRNGV